MRLRLLRRTHEDYDANTLQSWGDLAAGGEIFHRRIARYLLQHEREPKVVYDRRCKQAHYLNYAGPVLGYFVSLLFSSETKPQPTGTGDETYYAGFRDDVDGHGVDLPNFMARRFIEACTKRCSYWRIDFPGAAALPVGATKADFDKLGAGDARLVTIPPESVINWRRDDQGEYRWLLEHTKDTGLEDLEDEKCKVTETWTQWYADGTARRWQIAYAVGEKLDADKDVPEIDAPVNRLRRLPIFGFELPRHLHIMGHLAEPALEHFRKRNALSWLIERTAYAMPYFFLADPQKPPVMGTGYYGILGKDDKVEWPAPPSTPFAVIGEYVSTLKDEIHRVSQQMARGVDNNAAAVGRSGDSKKTDNASTEVVLKEMGRIVCQETERTLDAVSEGRGDSVTWEVGGMDSYNIEAASSVIESAVELGGVEIKSVTWHREHQKRVAHSTLPGAPDDVLVKIDQEIDRNVTEESLEPPPPPAPTTPEQPDPEQPPTGEE